MAKGRFIVLEGIDGCGSTTQARLLVQRLAEQGQRAHLTCEPSRGPVGALIRQALGRKLLHPPSESPHELDWATMALLFAADRADHVKSEIVPALSDGRIVVSDRYDLSSLAYQSLTAPESGGGSPTRAALTWISTINQYALRPDLTIVLNVSAETAEIRRKTRGGPEELYEHTELQRRLATLYSRAEELVPLDRVVHVSAEGSEDEVGQRVWRVVAAKG